MRRKWLEYDMSYNVYVRYTFLLLVVMDVTSTKFVSLFNSNPTSELKLSALEKGSDSLFSRGRET